MSYKKSKSGDESLIILSRRLRTLSLCNNTFFQAETEQEVLQSICEIVAAGDDLRLVWIGYCENDEKGSVRPVAKAGTGLNDFDGAWFSGAAKEATPSPVSDALRSGRACCVNDISTDARFLHWRTSATEAGFASCIAFPLMAHDKRQGNIDLNGSFQLCSGEREFFDESAIEHYAGLATCLTFAVAGLRRALAEGLTSGVAALRANQDRKQAQDRLRTMREELTRFKRLLEMGQMAASIAHEIKQPLAAIVMSGNAGLRWLSCPTPDLGEARTALERIVHEGHRADQVIAGIRSMFKKGEQAKAPHNVNDILREVLTLVHGEVESHQVSVRTELEQELPQVLVDRVQLQQVILNLIMNALEAMSSQEVRARVLHLRSEIVEPSSVMLSVRDTGTGIDKDNIDRIFEAFYTTKPTGMGLGLAICRSIVEAHGGSLSAARDYPHGSVLQLVLPSHQREDAWPRTSR
jgi:signal transduction histidine kinase